MAADITGLIGHLGLARAHLAGISLGGRIAMSLALTGRSGPAGWF